MICYDLYSLIGQPRYKFGDKFGRLRWSEMVWDGLRWSEMVWASSVLAFFCGGSMATWQAERGALKWFSDGSESLNKRLVSPCNAKHLAHSILKSTGMCFHHFLYLCEFNCVLLAGNSLLVCMFWWFEILQNTLISHLQQHIVPTLSQSYAYPVRIYTLTGRAGTSSEKTNSIGKHWFHLS